MSAAVTVEDGAVAGPDGRARCRWAVATEDLLSYHDTEWGRPVRTDTGLYERMVLEAFQAGLSWLTILRKRAALRRAFAGFDPERVASYDDSDIERLLNDAAIVRNRAKVQAAIHNAGAVLQLSEPLADLLWSFAPTDAGPAPQGESDVPARTPASQAMARELKRRGFVFVGPTTCYALMQAAGLVNDHLADCAVRVDQARK